MHYKKRFQDYRNVKTPAQSVAIIESSVSGDVCYICGNQCEVMQSMMHAYTEIHVCGDCMFEHLYPFIETVKKIESEVKRD